MSKMKLTIYTHIITFPSSQYNQNKIVLYIYTEANNMYPGKNLGHQFNGP